MCESGWGVEGGRRRRGLVSGRRVLGCEGWGPDRPEEGGREHTDHKMTVLSCECVCVSVCECVCIMHTVSMCMDVCLQYERTC